MAFALAAACARADTITLKDGTVLDGDITAEDTSSVSVYLEFAGGTITETRRVSRADIVRIVRLTPEQRAAAQARRDYESLEKFQLNPNASYRLDYYDRIVRDVFHKFLANHPDSLYMSNVTERIAQWETERDRVASGKMKFRGQWLPVEEGARLAEHERGQQLLEQSGRLISRGQFETAIQRLQSVLSLSAQPDLIARAKPLLASAIRQEIASFDRQRQQLAADVASAQQWLDRAQQAVNTAEGAAKQPTSNVQSFGRSAPATPGYRAMGDNSSAFVQNQNTINSARSNLAQAQSYLNQTRSQLDEIDQKRAAVQSEASTLEAKWGITVGGGSLVVANAQPTASPPASEPQPEVIVGFVAWLQNYWAYMAGGLVVLLFLLSRLMR